MTVAVPGALTQPDAVVSVTESVSGVPAVPAVKVIWLVPCPPVIVPFPTDQAYELPAWLTTLATLFCEPAPTTAGAVMTGVAGTGLTVCVQLPAALVHPAVVPVTVYVVVVAGETVIVRVVAPVDQA